MHLLVVFLPCCICSFLLYMTTFLLHLLGSLPVSHPNFSLSLFVIQHLSSSICLPASLFFSLLSHMPFPTYSVCLSPLPFFISFSCWWHVKPIKCLYACEAVSRQGVGHSFKLSKITEKRSQGDLSCYAKINTISLINRRVHIQEILHVKTCVWVHVCVCMKSMCVCACLVGWAGNVCILQRKGPTGCLQIVWLIPIATRGLQSHEPVVKNSINLH